MFEKQSLCRSEGTIIIFDIRTQDSSVNVVNSQQASTTGCAKYEVPLFVPV
jgi:hypothetical protein